MFGFNRHLNENTRLKEYQFEILVNPFHRLFVEQIAKVFSLGDSVAHFDSMLQSFFYRDCRNLLDDYEKMVYSEY